MIHLTHPCDPYPPFECTIFTRSMYSRGKLFDVSGPQQNMFELRYFECRKNWSNVLKRWLLTTDEESVVGVARRMLLRLEERIEVPETTLNKPVGGHLTEAERKQKRRYIKCSCMCGQLRTQNTDPISRRICRNCVRTLRSGWRWPLSIRWPSALKLYALKRFVRHAPLSREKSIITRSRVTQKVMQSRHKKHASFVFTKTAKNVGKTFFVDVFSTAAVRQHSFLTKRNETGWRNT